jgi:hypothetical protein
VFGHTGIDAALPEQFLVAAVFDDRSVIQDVNAIAAHDRADLMADQHDRVLGFQRTQGLDYDLLVFRVESAGRFVEQKDGRKSAEV